MASQSQNAIVFFVSVTQTGSTNITHLRIFVSILASSKCICRRPKQSRILGCKRPSSFSTLRYTHDEDAAPSLYIDTSCYYGVYLEQGTASLRDCNVLHALTDISAVSADNAVLDVRSTDLVSNETMQLEMPSRRVAIVPTQHQPGQSDRPGRFGQDEVGCDAARICGCEQSQYHLQQRR